MSTEELIAELNSLPTEERARVADHVLRSLNPPQPDIDEKWAAVAKRRLEELESGMVQAIPGEEVFGSPWLLKTSARTHP